MENPNKVVEFLLKNAGKYAQAKAERIYLDEFKKSKKALLMQQGFTTQQHYFAHLLLKKAREK